MHKDNADLLAAIRTAVVSWANHYLDASGHAVSPVYLSSLTNDVACELGILDAPQTATPPIRQGESLTPAGRAPKGSVEATAEKMRAAYAKFCGDEIVPWSEADPAKKRAWRCCATAAEGVFLRDQLTVRASAADGAGNG